MDFVEITLGFVGFAIVAALLWPFVGMLMTIVTRRLKRTRDRDDFQ